MDGDNLNVQQWKNDDINWYILLMKHYIIPIKNQVCEKYLMIQKYILILEGYFILLRQRQLKK